MKKYLLCKIGLAALFLIYLFTSCEKELSITDFTDDFSEYESELRIEAILDPADIMKTTVRVDRTILITDTTIFNGRDDDNDWVGYEDLNGNGKWDSGEPLNDDLGEDGFDGSSEYTNESDDGEGNGIPDSGEPHVDELDEILPQIHVRNVDVFLYRLVSENQSDRVLVADFQWIEQANSYEVDVYQDPDSTLEEIITYGAYQPSQVYEDIQYYQQYLFEIVTPENRIIQGTTSPLPPAMFENSDHIMDNDTILVHIGDPSGVDWTTDSLGTVCWVTIEKIYPQFETDIIISYGYSGQPLEGSSRWLYQDITSFSTPGLYRWAIAVPDQDYGAYFYSELPINDEGLNNLRDDQNNVVLGIAGSSSCSYQYVRVLNGMP